MTAPLVFRIYKDNKLVEVKQFHKEQIVIGNNAEVNLDLRDDQVSAIHCLVELRDSGFYICDLGSSVGTKKNGQLILDEPLSSGDNIEVGPYRLQVFVGAPKAVSTEPVVSKPEIPNVPQASAQVTPPPASPPAASLKAELPVEAVIPSKSVAKSESKSDVTLIDNLKATKGPVVQVIVCWQDRVLETYHFSKDQNVTIGSAANVDVFVPHQFMRASVPFLEIKNGCRILVGIEMESEIRSAGSSSSASLNTEELAKLGKAVRTNSGIALRLDQGEMAKLSIGHGAVQIYVRYVPASKKPILGAPLDFSAGELTSLAASAVLVFLTALYMSVYTPPEVEKPEEQEVERLAKFIYNKPPVVQPPPPPPEPQPPAPPPVPQVQKLELKDGKTQAAASGAPAGRAAEVRSKPSKVDRPKKFTSVKQGGSVKVGDKEGANAASAPPKDVSKVGLLGAFGTGGVRSQLDQAYQGSGDLLGMANQATGQAGQAENRAGSDIGSRFRDSGAGGSGTATQGIAGIGTKGRASGNAAYGSGTGFGGKGNVNIAIGGDGEAWVGTIDREAVRAVILSIRNQLESCYNRRLRVVSGLSGRVIIKFEIAEQGRVRSASVASSTLKDSEVESCVAARIKDARFPDPPAGVIAEIQYPFVFQK